MTKGTGRETYYDILNVRSDCSDKEIKTAYVQLSKKFHPDVKGLKTDPQQTAQFLKVVEAYQTLSKPRLRNEYDLSLEAARSTRIYETGSYTQNGIHRPWEIKPDYDPKPGPYYGIRGLSRTTNSKVALVLIVLGLAGGVFGFVSIKQSFSMNQKRLDEISAKANEHHQKVRSDVEKYSKDEQLRRVINRIVSQAER